MTTKKEIGLFKRFKSVAAEMNHGRVNGRSGYPFCAVAAPKVFTNAGSTRHSVGVRATERNAMRPTITNKGLFKRWHEYLITATARDLLKKQAAGADDTVAAPCPIRPGDTGEAQDGN